MHVFDSGLIQVSAGTSKKICNLPTLPNGILIHEISVFSLNNLNAGFLAGISDYPKTTVHHLLPQASGAYVSEKGPLAFKPENPDYFQLLITSVKSLGSFRVHMLYEELNEIKKKLS